MIYTRKPVPLPPRWGVMFEDGSIAARWAGRTAQVRAEDWVMANPHCIPVQWVEAEQQWVEHWPLRPRWYAIQCSRNAEDAGAIYSAVCLVCEYATAKSPGLYVAGDAIRAHVSARHRGQHLMFPCAHPGCPGDGRYAPPGRGHLEGCRDVAGTVGTSAERT